MNVHPNQNQCNDIRSSNKRQSKNTKKKRHAERHLGNSQTNFFFGDLDKTRKWREENMPHDAFSHTKTARDSLAGSYFPCSLFLSPHPPESYYEVARGECEPHLPYMNANADDAGYIAVHVPWHKNSQQCTAELSPSGRAKPSQASGMRRQSARSEDVPYSR